MINAINEFIFHNNEPCDAISNPDPVILGSTLRWTYKYTFTDGVELAIHYSRPSEHNINRTLDITYNGKNYLHARAIQRKIDTFLTDQNLLATADWKLEKF